ncbi:TPA: hypothetical protein LTW58_003160 [Enterobacter hormaechei]|uniref:alpha/beta fold hydrolase n=1 Tax=Enterobacter hormaechei TaxID=158836 RepID=UPI000798DC06|nr:alpha/beta fold hydrolase [Enterobacter hormaechei]CZZ00765.1 Alpha/beta hydrolase family [Enterobacter hormaechei]HAV7781227.1 hypothetical protein [Escherichia coli]HBL8910222.1 hypothetical protein [Enterobacter hormaechei]
MQDIKLSTFGSFIAGGEVVRRQNTVGAEEVTLRHQAYVEYYIPSDLSADRPAIILTHNYFAASAWLSNVDGKEGWAQYFLRNGHPVYVIDPPGSGRAGFNPDDIDNAQTLIDGAMSVDKGFWPGQDSSAWAAWNMGPEWGVPGDGILQGNQMPGDEASRIRLLGTLIPNKPVSDAILDDTFISMLEKVNDMSGPAVFVAWSMAGGLGQRLLLKRPELFRALILLDGYSGENRFPQPGKWFDNGPISEYKKLAAIMARNTIPLLNVNSAGGHYSNTGHSGELNQTLVAQIRTENGKADSVFLPEHGIPGNSHMMFFEQNSDDVAELLKKWIADIA